MIHMEQTFLRQFVDTIFIPKLDYIVITVTKWRKYIFYFLIIITENLFLGSKYQI